MKVLIIGAWLVCSSFAFANGPSTEGIAPSTSPEASGDTSIFSRSMEPDMQKRLDQRQEMESEIGRPSGVNEDHEKQKKELEEKHDRKRSQPK